MCGKNIGTAVILILCALGLGSLWYWHSHIVQIGNSTRIQPVQQVEPLEALPAQEGPIPTPTQDKRVQGQGNATLQGPLIVGRAQDAGQIRQALNILGDATQSDTARNEAINLLRRSNYKGLPDDLIQILNDPDESERFRRFCVQHLGIEAQKGGTQHKEAVLSVLRESLSDRHLGVRREALLALVNSGDPTGKEKAVEWLVAENANDTRDLAIRCVQQMDLKEHIPKIRKYVYDDNEVTRIAAIVALSQWGDEESRPAFAAASKSENVRLQRAGKAALERLDEVKRNRTE